MSTNKVRKFHIIVQGGNGFLNGPYTVNATSTDAAIAAILSTYSPESRRTCKAYAFSSKPTVYDGKKADAMARELRERAEAAARMLGY